MAGAIRFSLRFPGPGADSPSEERSRPISLTQGRGRHPLPLSYEEGVKVGSMPVRWAVRIHGCALLATLVRRTRCCCCTLSAHHLGPKYSSPVALCPGEVVLALAAVLRGWSGVRQALCGEAVSDDVRHRMTRDVHACGLLWVILLQQLCSGMGPQRDGRACAITFC